MNKARLNYGVDVITGIAFGLSAMSGLVFLWPSSTSGAQVEILGVGYRAWSQLHTWSSLAMVAGVLAHPALHWQWLVVMTRKVLPPAAAAQHTAGSSLGHGWSRRRALQLGGLALISGAAVVGYKVFFGTHESAASAVNDADPSAQTTSPALSNSSAVPALPSAESKAPAAPSMCLACPRNISYDRYPGRCRLYIDRDGDGYCDYSIPSACSTTNQPGGSTTTPGNRRNRSVEPSRTY